MCGHDIEVVDTFTFLGVTFSKTRLFTAAKNTNVQQAHKALFSIYRNIPNLDIHIDGQLKLFDSTIVSILTHECEVWSFDDLAILENIHTDFIVYFKCKEEHPAVMLYGEWGR